MFVTLTKDFLGQVAGKVFDVADADAQALITSGVAEACPNDPLAPIIQKSMEALTTNVPKVSTRSWRLHCSAFKRRKNKRARTPSL